MRWMLSLDGGPRRVNHAAVAIGDKIYSFGGYSASDPLDSQSDFIDIHLLNTFSYRWERLPVFPRSDFSKEATKFPTKLRSATISTPGATSGDQAANLPSTSADRYSTFADVRRRRARSLTEEMHPLAQIRSANPPLDETANVAPFANNAIQRQRSIPSRCDEMFNTRNGFARSLLQPQRRRSVHARGVIDEEGGEEDSGGNSVQLDALRRESQQQRLFGRVDADFDGSDIYNSDGEEDASSLITVETDSGEDSAEQRMDTDGEYSDDDAEMGELAGGDGFDEEEEGSPADDLLILAKLRQHPEIPFKRYGHTVVAYRGFVYLWGGRNDKLGCNQMLHRYDPADNRWSVVPTEGQCPPSRDGHSAVVDGDFMLIFGGFEEREHRFSQETYAFHFPTKMWRKLKTEGEPPQYRDFHAACVLDGKMYVFGGRSDEMGQLHTSHDIYCEKLHCLELKTLRWHRPEVKEPKTAPCGRRSLTMWTYRNAIYLFGGYQSIQNSHYNDLWRFDPTTGRWDQMLPSGHAPSPRRRQCTVLVGDRVFLFGGTMPNGGRKSGLSDLGDLYVLDFEPSLAALCCQTVLNFGVHCHAEGILPDIVMKELHYMSTPNRITKSQMSSSDR